MLFIAIVLGTAALCLLGLVLWLGWVGLAAYLGFALLTLAVLRINHAGEKFGDWASQSAMAVVWPIVLSALVEYHLVRRRGR